MPASSETLNFLNQDPWMTSMNDFQELDFQPSSKPDLWFTQPAVNSACSAHGSYEALATVESSDLWLDFPDWLCHDIESPNVRS